MNSGVLIFVGVILFGLAIVFKNMYNGLVFLRTQLERAWSNIDVLLKQRTDMLPNLIETCKGYM